MKMKAITVTLSMVVASIAILITGVVVVTMFGSGMTQMQSLTKAREYCFSQLAASCGSLNTPPLTWGIANVKTGDGLQSCRTLTGTDKCPSDGIREGEVLEYDLGETLICVNCEKGLEEMV